MSYEQDIKIDENALDIEWLDQAALMMRYAKISAQANLERDRAKVDLDLKKAELDRKIRNNPDFYKIEKITENAIMNAIIVNPEYVEVQETYQMAEYEASVARSAVFAFDARKTALENLVKLHGQQYFAGPRVPRDLAEEREMRQKRVDEGVAGKMKRRPL